MQHSTAKGNWGKATGEPKFCLNILHIVKRYYKVPGSDVSLDCEAIYCTNTACSTPILITSTVRIETLYGSIVSSLHNAADGNIPTNDINSGSGPHAIPGWNERVKSAHALARDAFKCWIVSGKARQGTEYEEMKYR